MMEVLSKVLGRMAWVVTVTIVQIIGGVALGTATVMAFNIYIQVAPALGLLPGDWRCDTRPVKSIEVGSVDFNVDAEECSAGARFVQTTTAIRASRRGEGPQTKVFEYSIPRRGVGELVIEQVDARTVRVVMASKNEAGREIDDARYMGLRSWGEMTFVVERRDLSALSPAIPRP